MEDTINIRELVPDAGVVALEPLLKAIAGKDNNAFEAFYDATVRRVYGLAVRITQSQEMAEEVVGDVYLQVWRQASRFDSGRGGVMGWLTVLCRSRALDMLRRTKSSASEEPLDAEAQEDEAGMYAQDLLLAVERNTWVHAALQELDDEQRQLLALAYFRGLSHSELAQLTGLPIGTVKTQLRRTLIALKGLMPAGISSTGGPHE